MADSKPIVVGDYTYAATDTIGNGSFATVFRGKRVSDGRLVAIKRIDSSKLKSSKSQKLLKQEIAIMRGLDHPNIVLLLTALEQQNGICLVMEYCDGGDLQSLIKSSAPLPEELVCHIAQQMASALEYLRVNGIVHRDLKPHNVLLTGDKQKPTIKLADFGFARTLAEEEMAATFCGSPLYMAPEVLEGKTYTAKADLWSVGTILYACATGKPPFRAPSMHALRALYKSSKNKVAFPDTLSPELVDLLGRLLAINPDDRVAYEEFFAHPFLAVHMSDQQLMTQAQDTVPSQQQQQTLINGVSTDSVADSYVVVDEAEGVLSDLEAAAHGEHPRHTQRPADLVARISQWLFAKPQGPVSQVDLAEFLKHANLLAVQTSAIVKLGASKAQDLLHHHQGLTDLHNQPHLEPQHAEALLLFAKAHELFETQLPVLFELCNKDPRILKQPQSQDVISKLRLFYTHYATKLDTLKRCQVPAYARSLPDLQSPNHILYTHAIQLCQDAMANLRDTEFDRAYAAFDDAIALFQVVLAAVKGKAKRDQKVLERYIERTIQHRDRIALKYQHVGTHRRLPQYSMSESFQRELNDAVQPFDMPLEPDADSSSPIAVAQHPRRQHLQYDQYQQQYAQDAYYPHPDQRQQYQGFPQQLHSAGPVVPQQHHQQYQQQSPSPCSYGEPIQFSPATRFLASQSSLEAPPTSASQSQSIQSHSIQSSAVECPHCGYHLESSHSVARFCSQCGKQLSTVATSSPFSTSTPPRA
eukprot:m.260492 g.260492  ORF g.260492 m.260492 type:complete len:755 (+) comp15562_c0_seq4:925-3189(+)